MSYALPKEVNTATLIGKKILAAPPAAQRAVSHIISEDNCKLNSLVMWGF